jgi:hypothetical protein
MIIEKKTKYMKINVNATNSRKKLIIDGDVFERDQNFRCLKKFVDSKNVIIEEVNLRTAAGSRWLYSLKHMFSSRGLEQLIEQLKS